MRARPKAGGTGFLAACLGGFILAAAARGDTDLMVATDGGAPFRTVQEAINATPQNASASNQVFIHIRPGTYRQAVYVQREKRFFHLVGEDVVKTRPPSICSQPRRGRCSLPGERTCRKAG